MVLRVNTIKKIIIIILNIVSIRNFVNLSKFLKGIKITRIKPITLLMKNLGYLKILVQKLFIKFSHIS